MGVSLYYTAERDKPLSEAETSVVKDILTRHNESFPFDDEESLTLYDDVDPGEILTGSTGTPIDFELFLPVLENLLEALTALRRALPDAQWTVTLDESDAAWDDQNGYTLE